MAKGDHERSERRGDEQMKQGQSYLTGLQSQLAGQYGGLSQNYFGQTPSATNNTFGFGSTVPHYSHTGQPYYQGNGTDVPTNPVGSGMSQGAQQNYQQTFNQMFPDASLSPQQLKARESELAQHGIKVLSNAKGTTAKIQLPNGQIIDVIGGAESGRNIRQWYDASPGSGGGSMMSPMSAFGGGATGLAFGDYGGIKNQLGSLMGRWSQFADNGGFSPGDLANIRSRAVSPIRSIYSSARQGLDRQRALQGGYSPGYATALGRFSREQGQLTSDAATNAEAAIAEMTQRGKLAGLGGMNSTIGNMLGLYGATPGLANMFGQQMLSGMGQQLQAAGLQNQLSLGLMNNQNQISQIPGNYQNILGNIGGTIGLGGQIGGMIYPWLGGGSSGVNPVNGGVYGV